MDKSVGETSILFLELFRYYINITYPDIECLEQYGCY